MKKFRITLLALLLLPLFKVGAFSLLYSEDYNNDELKVRVAINKETSLETIESLINFNTDVFELIKIDENKDVQWLNPPYLNENGQVSFTGNFNSNNSFLFDLYFQRKTEGEIDLKIASGVVQRNKRVRSSTHPKQDIWYANNDLKLEWDLPEDAQIVKILIDKKEDSYPTIEYSDPIIFEKEIDLDEGVWYFHFRYFGDEGWSLTEHRKIMIDTKVPEFLDVVVGKDRIEFFAEDELSGIDYYEISIPQLGEKYITEETSFEIPKIREGTYEFTIRAYDKASNFLEKKDIFKVENTFFPEFSAVTLENRKVTISGFVNDIYSRIFAFIEGEDMSEVKIVNVFSDSSFEYVFEDLKPGVYSFRLANEDLNESDRIILIVKESEKSFFAYFLILCVFIILSLVLIYNKFLKKKKV